MTAIKTTFGQGGANMTPSGQGSPTLAQTLREIADDLAAIKARSDTAMQAKLDSLIGKFNAHIGTAGIHLESDTANTVSAPAATDVTVDILALVNAAYDAYEAHRVNVTGSIHGAADTTNVVTATYPATTEAEAVALMNDIKAMYQAHRILTAGSVHGGADNTNTIASADATDWDSVVTLANEFKNTTGFNAHIALQGGVHGADGSADAIAAANAGVQITALYLEVNEFKTDLNAHIAHLGVHPIAGVANGTTAATTEATAVALINGLKATANTHFASATDHLDADTTTIAAADATEYEDILTLVAAWRAAYNAHRVKTAVHAKADATNVETVLGAGGAVTLLTTKG